MVIKLKRRSILGIREQAARLRMAFPGFSTRVRGAWLTAEGVIQPTPLNDAYRVQFRYAVGEPPEIRVLSPALICREGEARIPHMYDQERLCLYLPGAGQWSGELSLGHAFVPWTALWLYYYELWHATGEWLGGGVEPTVKDPIKRDKKEITHGKPSSR